MSTVYRQESFAVRRASFEAYREKVYGFVEAVYQQCLEIEFGYRHIPFKERPSLAITYKGCPLKIRYTRDFVCYDKIIVELKAVSALTDEHRARVHNYLRATGVRLGLLVNLAPHPKLDYERIVL